MASITSTQEALKTKYRQQIEQLWDMRTDSGTTPWPGLTKLRAFINENHRCTKPPEILIAEIPGETGHASEFSIAPLRLHQDPPDQLPSLADASLSSQLIIVENICPETLLFLGGTYDIDPQFFAEHINVLTWYKMNEKIPERLPSLPSTRKAEDFLSLKYVETRELLEPDDASIYASSVYRPDETTTRIRHTAGRLRPVSGPTAPEQEFPPIVFTRQTVSIWCQKKINSDGWISIMLLDPPFQLDSKHGRLYQAEYRSPGLRPNANQQSHSVEPVQTFRQAFCRLLEYRCSTDKTYLKMCATNTFLIFYEGYRVVASEWLVVNEYVKRELANIERHLEKRESTLQELEHHLKELYRIRRRCNKDYELAREAALQCEKRGQALWPSSKVTSQGNADTNTFADCKAQELEDDFKYVLDNMSISISRIEKNINLLMALVAISGGRQSLRENRGISFLTLIATIFLPSSTVATILGIQTQFGPGAHSFWVLWAVALPVTVVVIMIPFLYSRATPMVEQLWDKPFPLWAKSFSFWAKSFQFWAKSFRAKSNAASKPPTTELLGGEIDVEKSMSILSNGTKPIDMSVGTT